MKILGNKNEFAIEYDLMDVEDATHYFGDIFFWIGNKKIGDDTKVAYLSSSVGYLKEFLSLKESRRFIGSEKIPDEYMFFITCERFYIDSYIFNTKDYIEAGTYRQIFSLESIGQENFMDTVKMVLIDEPAANRQRFLWKLFKDGKLEEFFIPYGYFEQVAIAFINEIEKDVTEWAIPT